MTRQYSTEPTDPDELTRQFDRFYSRLVPIDVGYPGEENKEALRAGRRLLRWQSWRPCG